MSTRENALNEWLATTQNLSSFTLSPLAGDASFRRYFRLKTLESSFIIMDAPPEKEGLLTFIQISQLLAEHNIHTPHITAFDLEQGFAILEDLGDMLLYHQRSAENTPARYKASLDTLITIQSTPSLALPRFDIPFMLQEMSLFQTWFLEAWLGLTLKTSEKKQLTQTLQQIATHLSLQPQCFIHRDYHSRNLLIIGNQSPPEIGVIDFQDAMHGPFTYDLVSLIKDCYIHWPEEQQLQWITYFYHHLPSTHGWSLTEFEHGVHWCGLQRHLKVLGVFSRLHLRDHKSTYLQDLPLTLHHTLTCLEKYDAFSPILELMQERVLPAFRERQPA
jgi:aminoglycoside/choline kinase family phosphotransferase